MKHVIQMSGGLASWLSAERVKAKHGIDNLWLVFCDTIVEDADLYRFLIEAAAHVYGVSGVADLTARAAKLPPIREDAISQRKAELVSLARDVTLRMPKMVWLSEGRTPWEVFRDERFLGNSRVDPCSKILKREQSDAWRVANCDPADTTIYLGFGWNEQGRIEKLRKRFGEDWAVQFPMDDPPYLTRIPMMQAALDCGIRPPRLYYHGFKHNNCGGLCCKAGQAQNAKLLWYDPCLYGFGERQENALRVLLGDVSMMSDRRGGEKKRLTLEQFRKRLEVEPNSFDATDHGACSCFAESDDGGVA